jgi:ABC-type lipoprotein export system ATPase subunit
MLQVIIQAKKLSRYFGVKSNPTKALDSIDFEVHKGDFTVILGRSGSGKSTLLNLLCGLDKSTAGSLSVNGEQLSDKSRSKMAQYRSTIGIIFQQYNLLPNLSAIENVMIGAWAGGTNVTKTAAQEVMKKFGLDHRENVNVKTLSGGERQRLAICRALIANPEVIFCDEPTGALDSENEKNVMEILHTLHKEGRTIVLVTHNPDFTKLATKIIEMSDGKITKTTKK